MLRKLRILPLGDSTGSHEPPVVPPSGTTVHMLTVFCTPAFSSQHTDVLESRLNLLFK